MGEITVYVVGRIVESADIDIDPTDYYLDCETKEEAIENLKKDLRKAFTRQHGEESFDEHDDADYHIDEFLSALDEFDWDVPFEDRYETMETDR